MLPLRRTTGGSTTTAWEEFDKKKAFIRPERTQHEFETGKEPEEEQYPEDVPMFKQKRLEDR